MSNTLLSRTRRTLTAAAAAVLALAGTGAQAAGNPYEYVGEQHNIILACILENDPYGKMDPFYTIIDICLFDAGMSSKEFSAQYTPLMPADLTVSLDEMLKPYRESFNDTQYAFLSETERILSTQDPKQAAVSLDELETKAVETLSGKEPGDVAVLAGLSTARHSLQFWTGATTSPVRQSMSQAKAKWWQVVLADVAGGIVGGVFGGGVGAVGLGTACSGAVAKL